MPDERDWEAAAVRRLEGLVAGTVEMIRDYADQIEREAKHNIKSAGEPTRVYDFHTYGRAAGAVVHDLQTMLFNLKLDSLIDAAGDAEAAHLEKASKA